MVDSPASFWSGDELDQFALASRLPAAEFDRDALAQLLHLSPASVWVMVRKGRLPKPHHYELMESNNDRAVWRADQLTGLVGA